MSWQSDSPAEFVCHVWAKWGHINFPNDTFHINISRYQQMFYSHGNNKKHTTDTCKDRLVKGSSCCWNIHIDWHRDKVTQSPLEESWIQSPCWPLLGIPVRVLEVDRGPVLLSLWPCVEGSYHLDGQMWVQQSTEEPPNQMLEPPPQVLRWAKHWDQMLGRFAETLTC